MKRPIFVRALSGKEREALVQRTTYNHTAPAVSRGKGHSAAPPGSHVRRTRSTLDSTLRRFDRIVVLEDGKIVEKIVEEGSHADLIARGCIYAGVYEKQASRYQ